MVKTSRGMKLGRVYAAWPAAFLTSGWVFAATGTGNTEPPTIDESISRAPSAWRASTNPAEGLTLGETRVEFERTTLSDVQGSVKTGTIRHKGDAGASVYWLCYAGVEDQSGDDKALVRLWIESSGEMGGPDHAVTSIVVERMPTSEPSPACPALSKEFRSLEFDNGLHIGTTRASLEKMFASGLVKRGNQSFIGYQHKVAGNGKCGGDYDRLNSLLLVFQSDRLAEIHAGQVTSC